MWKRRIAVISSVVSSLLVSGCGRFGFALPDRRSPCLQLLEDDPSLGDGVYEVHTPEGDLAVECRMVGFGGGWTLLAARAPGDPCPGEWQRSADGQLCKMGRIDCKGAQRSAHFEPPVGSYQQVRGFFRGVQYKSTDAFAPENDAIDDSYVDGVSITYGRSARQHLWSYGSGLSDLKRNGSCPCRGGKPPPAWVGEHYYCDTGNPAEYESVWYTDRPLWDEDATAASCEPPAEPGWFERVLPAPTTAPIEIRLMADQCDEDIGISEMQLMVR